MGGGIILLLAGIVFTFTGGRILFTKRGVDYMYRDGIWKEGHTFGRSYDRFALGGSIFALGVILLVAAIAGFLIDLRK